MALDMNDVMMLKGMDHDGMSPYEQVKIGYMQSKRPSGTAITGVVLGSVAAALGIGAWIFAPIYAKSQAGQAKIAADAMAQGNQRQLDQLTSLLAAERSERINGDITLNTTVNQSGQQASNLTAQQAAELSAVNSVMAQTYSDFVTGRASINPTPVSLYSAPQPCGCPATGCSCNG